MKLKNLKKKSKTYKIINGLNQSTDGVSILAISSTCITLSVTGIGLVIVPIASGIGAGVCIFSKFIGEYLKRKEQHNMKNVYTCQWDFKHLPKATHKVSTR